MCACVQNYSKMQGHSFTKLGGDVTKEGICRGLAFGDDWSKVMVKVKKNVVGKTQVNCK